MTIYQIAVLGFVLFYFAVLLGFRSYLLYKNTGVNPFKKMGRTGIIGYNERVISFCSFLIPVIAFNYAFLETNYQYLIPIDYLEVDGLKNVGLLLSAIGLILSFVAQLQMKDSWRIGIDKEEETSLVKHGLYKYSRNPIYLGLGIAFLGFFLLAPNALSFTFLVLMSTSIGIKIRLEEAYMQEKHPKQFEAYTKEVRRWL